MSSQLVVHHLNNSRSQRILWLLEELGVPYTINKYQRTPDQRAPEELKAIHPLGTAPLITDGPITLGESGAIIQYILRKYGNGKAHPPESGEVDDLYYTHYAEGTLMPLLVARYVMTLLIEKTPFFVRPLASIPLGYFMSNGIDPRLEIHAQLIEEHLSKRNSGWFAGGEEPTSADYMMIFALESWNANRPGMLGPNTKAFIDKVHARPAYKRSIEKGGEYSYY